MKYSISFTEADYNQLLSHLFPDRTTERAAYLLCRFSVTDLETRFLVREIIPVLKEDIATSSSTHMTINSKSYVKAIKRARETKQGFIFVHSHPSGVVNHSEQDDKEELGFFKTVYERIPDVPVHASLVISDPEKPIARVWLRDGTNIPVSVIRTIGNRFHFYGSNLQSDSYPRFFDRQIRAFGEEIQVALKNMRVGIVGVGGTGSAVAEQLIRLGVGTLYLSDPESFETTNINRVYGSRVSDQGAKKIKIITRLAEEIGLGTKIVPLEKSITYESVTKELRNCDVVFGCTDDHWGRSILSRLATYYYIPVFDMGVKIDSKDFQIKSIQGRATTLLPGNACLICRGLDLKMVASESLEATDPTSASERRKDGYLPELPGTAPSVIPFTTIVASTAVIEFLHRLTGFLGDERETNEVIQLFEQTRIVRNARLSSEECFCGDEMYIGRGDTNPLLDITWRDEN
jgi:molybdopterin/thiamine biosynthesis adenylyltransferase